MRYWVRLLTALVLVCAGIATLGIAISQLADTGSCSTGGTPDGLPDCPSDTVWWIFSIFGAVAAFLFGLGVYATRGDRGGGSGSSGPVGPVSVRPVTTYTPPPPALPTTWPTDTEAQDAQDAKEAAEGDPLERLAKLGELKQAGVITESEFELQKAKLLSDI